MDPVLAAGFLTAFLVGILLHEAATAKLADVLGDKTPRMMRRVNLSIKQHADPLGTYIIPAVFVLAAMFNKAFVATTPVFGWGKRHNLSARGLRNPKRDVIFVALAGPLVTFGLAFLGGIAFRTTLSAAISAGGKLSPLTTFAGGFTLVCIFLTVIELLPIPGRDGGRILQRFLSPHAAMRFEEFVQYDMLFLLGIFLLGRLFTGILLGMADPVCRLVSGSPCAGLIT